MKKFYLSLTSLGIVLTMSAASTGLDLQSRAALRQHRTEKIPVHNAYTKALESAGIPATHVTALISLADSANVSELEAEGVNVVRTRGNIAMVSMPVDIVERVSTLKSVRTLSLSRRAIPKMDKVRDAMGVTKIHAGEDLPQAYTGKGVITGIVDQGVDPNNINFLNEDGSSRIGMLKHIYMNSAGTDYYEEDYTADNISRFKTDSEEAFHGTHTLGIMAGGYKGIATVAKGTTMLSAKVEEDNNPFYGNAPESDIAVSCGDLNDMFIATGIDDMLTYAYNEGKPAVINVSLGSNVGAHDGTETMSRFLDLAGQEAIICLAAGNEGELPIALNQTLTAEDTRLQTFIYPHSGTVSTSSGIYYNLRYGQVYIYSNDSTEFKVSMIVYNKERGTTTMSHTVSSNMEGSAVYYASPSYAGEGDISTNSNFNKAFDGYAGIGSMIDSNSGRYYAMIDYFTSDNQTYNSNGKYILGFIVEGKDGQRIDCFCDGAYTYLDGYGQEGWDNGSRNGSISDMACAKNILVVGSYNTRNVWVSLNGRPYNYNGAYTPGEISPFSSYGTLIDGRNLPHVCAPGAAVISSSNTYYIDYYSVPEDALQAKCTVNGRSNYWHQMIGTSMATPTVSGAIALWLEADPTLTIDEVKEIAMSTAVKDEYVTNFTGDPVQWGAGKFDAYAGLKEVIRRAAGVGQLSGSNAGERLIVTTNGNGMYTLFLGGAEKIDATLYNISGQPVVHETISGDEASINASHLTAGVYVLTVNGRHNQRILVK